MKHECRWCDGTGTFTRRYGTVEPGPAKRTRTQECGRCDGTGSVSIPREGETEAHRSELDRRQSLAPASNPIRRRVAKTATKLVIGTTLAQEHFRRVLDP